ncbi:hypothetical protein [Rhodoferax antarcticus]|uniref:hypothetical protein n=1 Tax=Rhodoferax antarcticus TaxID=81479 RepID=UPI000A688663|nr:hypothetical protein [Rhodoferax antarcticus]MCW2313041.1 hypothetical protein [Rhodoferax antarcticus]
MTTTNRPHPRFIPTLTEVVDPASLNSTARQTKPDVEAIISQVQRQVQPIFERRLQQELEHLVRVLVAKHWDDISVKLQTEMDMFLRQAVVDALASQNQANRQN